MRKILLLLLTVMTFSLTGCSSVKDYLDNQMLKKSGVAEDTNYQQYEQYANSGELDSEGYYVETSSDADEKSGQVHVTFANNNNLKIQYFTDASHENEVDLTNCYLDPGDSLYASVEISDDVYSSMYEFSGFRVYEFENDERKLSSTVKMVKRGEDWILTLPEDFSGLDLAIEPIGSYKDRTISLNDYCVDDRNQHEELSGNWFINDKTYTGDTAEISPVTPYIISYEYDPNEYFFLSSNPESYYSNNEDGIVIFNQRKANDETVDYSVALHKYLEITLVSDKDRKVSVNEGDEQEIKSNSELLLPHLKYGDRVTIKTDKVWSGLETNRELILTSSETLSDGYKYTFIVPEKDGEFLFDPNDYSYAHGTITFKCFGQVVSGPQVLAKGSKIYYEQATADNGYWLAGDNLFITVGDKEETIAALKAIHFTPKVDVTVNLPQPDGGGSVIYSDSAGGNEYKKSSLSTHSGDSISMKLKPWQGWMINPEIGTNEVTYKVGDDSNQTVTANGKKVDDIFVEDDGHKPELSVELEKSVGDTMQFTLKASGYSMEATNYGGGWKITDPGNIKNYNIISNTETLVNNQKIGTDKPINITMTNRAIQSGKAVRMIITLTDSDNNEFVENRYIDDLSKKLSPIYIYEPGTNADAVTWYKSVNIKIGVVDVEKYSTPSPSEHTKITVKNESTGKVLSSGDFIEDSQKITLTISPVSGYYVTGKRVSKDIYSKTMKYSDYVNEISDIIEKHPAEKYIRVILDKSDSFAKYTYKLDGKEVSGSINAKAGQKLELVYEITDSTYELTESHGGFVFGLGASTSKAAESITISSDMDGKTITKQDFNIQTRKGS